jgi:hypothetical protein
VSPPEPRRASQRSDTGGRLTAFRIATQCHHRTSQPRVEYLGPHRNVIRPAPSAILPGFCVYLCHHTKRRRQPIFQVGRGGFAHDYGQGPGTQAMDAIGPLGLLHNRRLPVALEPSAGRKPKRLLGSMGEAGKDARERTSQVFCGVKAVTCVALGHHYA